MRRGTRTLPIDVALATANGGRSKGEGGRWREALANLPQLQEHAEILLNISTRRITKYKVELRNDIWIEVAVEAALGDRGVRE